MVSENIMVTSQLGIHLRPAGAMCNEAVKYQANISFKYGEDKSKTHLSTTEQLTQVMPRKIFLSHYRRELQEDILLKISRTQLQARLSLQLTTL